MEGDNQDKKNCVDDNEYRIYCDICEKEMNDPRVPAMFKRPRYNILTVLMIIQNYYELPKRTSRANGNIYHIFKPNILRDVEDINRDKASMDMTLNEIKLLTSSCWDRKYQPLAIDMTGEKYNGGYRLVLNILFVRKTNPFSNF